MFSSASTSTRPSLLRTSTVGPWSMNRPVSSVASCREPPPLLRRSMTTPSTFSFCSSPRSFFTSRVVLLYSGSPARKALKSR
ncbi:hypothetical protein D9M69_501140 [compost metagenome]